MQTAGKALAIYPCLGIYLCNPSEGDYLAKHIQISVEQYRTVRRAIQLAVGGLDVTSLQALTALPAPVCSRALGMLQAQLFVRREADTPPRWYPTPRLLSELAPPGLIVRSNRLTPRFLRAMSQRRKGTDERILAVFNARGAHSKETAIDTATIIAESGVTVNSVYQHIYALEAARIVVRVRLHPKHPRCTWYTPKKGD